MNENVLYHYTWRVFVFVCLCERALFLVGTIKIVQISVNPVSGSSNIHHPTPTAILQRCQGNLLPFTWALM